MSNAAMVLLNFSSKKCFVSNFGDNSHISNRLRFYKITKIWGQEKTKINRDGQKRIRMPLNFEADESNELSLYGRNSGVFLFFFIWGVV